MHNRFFSNEAAKYISISYEGFINAVKNGDSATIDYMLEAKNKGAKLDINNTEQYGSGNGLEILLKRRDFENASKLLKAGADTGVTTKFWVDDDGPYPYGGYETSRRDFFQTFSQEKDIINFLKKEVPDKYIEYKHGSSYIAAKKAYEDAKIKLELCEKNVKSFESDLSDREVIEVEFAKCKR